MKNFKFLFLILVFIFLFSTENVFACMCGSTSICDAYSQASAVIIGKIKKVEVINKEINQEVLLEVEKSFKGKGLKNIKLLQENTTCDWWFKSYDVGKSYLFYLSKHKTDKIYSVIACGRSSKIAEANDDLSWLDGLPKSLTRTRISGTVQCQASEFPPLADVKLKISSEKKHYEVTSDLNGLYEVWDVSAGTYSIVPTIPSDFILGWTTSVPNNWIYFWDVDEPDNKALEVKVESKKCGGVDFMFKRKKDEK